MKKFKVVNSGNLAPRAIGPASQSNTAEVLYPKRVANQ